MPITKRKFRLVNPSKMTAARSPRRRSTRAQRRATKRNPVHLVTLGFANPQRGTMKKRKKNSAQARVRSRQRNPFTSSKPRSLKDTARRRRRNPEMLGKATELTKQGASALVGLVAARQIPQMILGAKNTGIIGYLVTALTAFAAKLAVQKVAGPGAGNAALIGGSMQFASRLLNEYLSPVGKVLSLVRRRRSDRSRPR